MARYLSAEWFEEMSAALTASASSDGGGGSVGDDLGPGLVLQQVVTGGPDGDVTYRVEIGDGSVQIIPGAGPADVTITEDYDTAAALHRGLLTLQDAFQSGRVKVAGNVATLVARQTTLTGISCAATAAATTF